MRTDPHGTLPDHEDRILRLERRMRELLNRLSRQAASVLAGAGIFVNANTVHLSGSTILLRHPGAARLAEYPATTEGLQAAVAAAVAGDTVLLPGGTISLPPPAGTLTVSASRDTVKALVYPGSAPAGWNEAGFDDSAWSAPVLGTGVSGVGAAEVVWLGGGAGKRVLLRQSFTLSSPVASAVLTWDGDDTTNGVYVNGVLVDSWTGWTYGDEHPPRTVDVAAHLNPSGENVIAIDQSDAASGDWRGVTWELEIELTGISIPAGVEVIGLGKNSIIDGSIVNEGTLTNLTVTGTISGAGVLRLVYNAGGEQITDLVGFAAADHNHDTAYAAIGHDHTAGDIDSTGASDGQVLTADGLGGAAWETPAGGSVAASAVTVDASGFAGNLSPADTTVQAALQTIDAMTVSGGAAPGHAETIGDGAATSYTITHDLGTADVIVQVYDLDASPNPVLVDATVEIVDEDTVLVAFDGPPSTDQYRVVVVAVAEGAGAGGGRGLSESRLGRVVNPLSGTALNAREANWVRVVALDSCTLTSVKAAVMEAGAPIRCRVVRVTQDTGNATIAEIIEETAFQAVTPPVMAEFALSSALVKDNIYCVIIEVQSGATLRIAHENTHLGFGSLLVATAALGGYAARNVGVGGTLTAYSSSLPIMWLGYS